MDLLISLPRFGKLFHIIALNILSVPFAFSSPEIPMMQILVLLIVPHKAFFTLFLFFSFCSSDWIISNVLSSRSLIVSPAWSSDFEALC